MSHDNFDDIFELLDSDRLEALYDQYVEEYKDTPDPVTPELDAAMQKKFDELRRKEQRERTRKKLSRIAAALIISLGVGGFAITQTDAWKVTISNLRISFADNSQQMSQLSSSDLEILAALPKNIPYPRDIPSGYSVLSVDSGKTRTEIVYAKTDYADITFMIFFRDSPEFNQAALQSTAEKVKINNWDGFIIKHSEKYDLIWYTQTHIFKLSGCFNKNILVDVAESVE